MRYVEVTFRPNDSQTYCYAYDGAEEIGVGDQVEVETKRGLRTVTVAGFRDEAPPFNCKPILRVLPRSEGASP